MIGNIKTQINKSKKRFIDEKYTTITGGVILLFFLILCILGMISIEVFISTSVFPLGLLVSKDSWFGIKVKKNEKNK